jgi:hypothetical protein
VSGQLVERTRYPDPRIIRASGAEVKRFPVSKTPKFTPGFFGVCVRYILKTVSLGNGYSDIEITMI